MTAPASGSASASGPVSASAAGAASTARSTTARRGVRALAAGLAVVVAAGGVIGVVIGLALAVLRPPLDLARAADHSPLVLADDGSALRAYLSRDHKWRLPARTADVAPHYVAALVAYEDRRFWHHPGVDPLAMARAAWQALTTWRLAPGASTLTMQVARLLRPDGARGIAGKLVQIADAIELERRLDKTRILELYLTLAPLGSNVEGVRAASLIYFGKDARHLTPPEAAALIAVAQSPARRRPDRHPEAAAAGRDHVLARVIARGTVDPAWRRVVGAPLVVAGGSPPRLAAHLADRLLAGRLAPAPEAPPRPDAIATRIDAGLQARVETLAREATVRWPAAMNVAVLVLRNHDCAVRAYVGGADYLDHDSAGHFDHVRAVRSPGSTLKPLIYGLAFEDLLLHPATVVSDEPVSFEGYAPRNFNAGYQGEMTVRDALIRSINTTAVKVLAEIGPERLVTRLRAAGIPLRIADADSAAGLAVGLGGAGTSLESLTRLFVGLARRGAACPGELAGGAFVASGGSAGRPAGTAGDAVVLSSPAAWAVADILADVPPPSGFSPRRTADGGRRLAYKTGTSYGFRDAWAIGFDATHTVGVWLGRSDGAATLGATGAGEAAPLLHRVLDLLPAPARDVAGERPIDSVLARRGELPSRLRRLAGPLASASAGSGAGQGLRILFPRDASVVAVAASPAAGAASAVEAGATAIPLVASGGAPPYFWFVDGRPVASDGHKAQWRPSGPGQATARVVDGTGMQSEVSFWVE